MSLCVGEDDSLPEKYLLQGVKTIPAGGLATAPTSNCVTPICFGSGKIGLGLKKKRPDKRAFRFLDRSNCLASRHLIDAFHRLLAFGHFAVAT